VTVQRIEHEIDLVPYTFRVAFELPTVYMVRTRIVTPRVLRIRILSLTYKTEPPDG